MEIANSILQDVRSGVGLGRDNSDFDNELLTHINASIVKLFQNGIGNVIVVEDDKTLWKDLINPLQIEGNVYFQLVPLYVILSTKIIFDPPPPSSVELQRSSVSELLWRLKVAYEKDEVNVDEQR